MATVKGTANERSGAASGAGATARGRRKRLHYDWSMNDPGTNCRNKGCSSPFPPGIAWRAPALALFFRQHHMCKQLITGTCIAALLWGQITPSLPAGAQTATGKSPHPAPLQGTQPEQPNVWDSITKGSYGESQVGRTKPVAATPATTSSDTSPKRKTIEIESNLSNTLLKGRVTAGPSPFLYGSVETIPKGTKVNLTLTANLNSEISQKGDEVYARVSMDVKNGEKVLLPNGWYLHGIVSQVAGQRRLGRDGYLEIEFDKLVSPDGEHDVNFAAKLSTKDSTLTSLVKHVAIDSKYVGTGALGGAILSVELAGIAGAIATQGYSVAVGAGFGATVGAIAAMKRKGKIASFYPGDELKLTISEPLSLPGFNPEMLPSNFKAPQLAGLDISITKAQFGKDPFGDKRSRMLTLDFIVHNETDKELSLFDLAVVSDHHQTYYPSFMGDIRAWKKKVLPKSSEQATVSFSVDNPKHKYWLVLLDRKHLAELRRVPIN